MDITLTGAQVVGFIAFVVLTGPAIFFAGVMWSRQGAIRTWIKQHEEFHAEQSRFLNELSGLVARLDEHYRGITGST